MKTTTNLDCNIIDTRTGEVVVARLSKRSANAVVKAMAEGRCGNLKGLEPKPFYRVQQLSW